MNNGKLNIESKFVIQLVANVKHPTKLKTTQIDL